MAYTIVLILFSGLLSVRGTEDKDRCQEVSTINCDTHYVPDGDERVCSSDMKDCPTLCHFAQKKCKYPHITILGLGPCNLITGQTTTDPTTSDPSITLDPAVGTTDDQIVDQPITTDDPPANRTITSGVLATLLSLTAGETTSSSITLHPNCTDVICTVFCSHAGKITCPSELDPLCGNDGKFYTNDCVFAKAKCKDSNLVKQDLLLCKTRHRHRRELDFV